MTGGREGRARPFRAYADRERALASPRPLRVSEPMRLLDEQVTARVRGPRGGSAIPDRKPIPAFQEPDLVPGPGEGLLSLLVDGGATAPVAAVDGVPLTVGCGQLDLVLRAGPHTVEVQGVRTVDPVAVHIVPGGSHRLQYYEDDAVGHRVLGALPDTYAFTPTNAGCLWWLVLVSLLCGLPYAAVAWLQPPLLVSAITSGAISLALIAICVPAHRRSKARHRRALAAQRRAAPSEPVPHHGDAFLLGADPIALPPIPPGHAAIDLHLDCARHLWAGRRALPEGGFLARAWTNPPRVRIDGVERPASWGHWRYLVPPGAHQITILVDGRPANLGVPARHTGGTEEHADLTVDAPAGAAVRVDAEAHVYAIWRPASGEVESFRPRLLLEPVP
ncbi:hypothetical protein [Glycomyces paridis]|uniref:Uncharacterized protein n=1 Tax=Glycomyces paridis TaxID=2126555 RepID=A0A4S8PN83_9ACTN|nr:hypothetical protein [Glycomyces paridis]THV30099.1 hypothetical protein E9998_06895 [Glycomyces paridis]